MDVSAVMQERGRHELLAAERVGRLTFVAALVVFLAVCGPVVLRGAPLADDFTNCLAPLSVGLEGFVAASWRRLGMVRTVRFLEILLTTGVCRTLPFGVAIAVPLVLTLAVAVLVRGLLRGIDTPRAWADVGGALWLLQPLGTEAALWPAALHVPLGLTLALLALRWHTRGAYARAALAGMAAAMCMEQVIFVLPLAAWLVAPVRNRNRAAIAAGMVSLGMLCVFALFPGNDVRFRAGPAERIVALVRDPVFLVGFPAVGLGLHSIPLAVWWALPWTLFVLPAGAWLGAAAVRHFPIGPGINRRDLMQAIAATAILLALANAPVLLNVPHEGSPRIFTPTWLILVVVFTALAARVRWQRPWLAGALGGIFAAGAVLSLALSVSVRLASADFMERSARVLAARVPDGAEVAVCGVRRTVTTPAPRGSFAIHELLYDWSARNALVYYTGRRATFHLAGDLWPEPCPNEGDVDAVISFDELLARTAP
jgi:uncharacterized MnhB-related membrane protein